MPQRAQTPEYRELENRILVGDFLKGAFLGDDLAIRFAHRDTVTMGRAHHHALHDRLTADEGGFLAALKHGHELDVCEKTPENSQIQGDILQLQYSPAFVDLARFTWFRARSYLSAEMVPDLVGNGLPLTLTDW